MGDLWNDGLALATLIAGLAVFASAVLAFISGVLTRAGEMEQRRKAVSAEAISKVYALESTLRNYHVPGAEFGPDDQLIQTETTIDRVKDGAYETLLLLHSIGTKPLAIAAAVLANRLTIAISVLHPTTGAGLQNDFDGSEEILETLSQSRMLLSRLSRSNRFSRQWILLFANQQSPLKKKNFQPSPLFEERL
ncbi:hypothetical protein GCM10009526_08850 [Glutamicibacter creatinolyticus]